MLFLLFTHLQTGLQEPLILNLQHLLRLQHTSDILKQFSISILTSMELAWKQSPFWLAIDRTVLQ